MATEPARGPATEDETRAAKQTYRAWRARTDSADSAAEEDDWARDQMHGARRRWLACAPTGPTAWWPGGWRIRLASGALHFSCGVRNAGVWRTRADAERFLLDPVTDPAVATLSNDWWPNIRDMLSGATIEWAAVINGTYPVALDDDFWSDVDNGRPWPEI